VFVPRQSVTVDRHVPRHSAGPRPAGHSRDGPVAVVGLPVVGHAVRVQLAEELRQAQAARQADGRRPRTSAQRHAVRTGAVQQPERVHRVRQLHQVPGGRHGTLVLHHQQVHPVHTQRPGFPGR